MQNLLTGYHGSLGRGMLQGIALVYLRYQLIFRVGIFETEWRGWSGSIFSCDHSGKGAD